MAVGQLLVGITAASQPFEKTMAIIKLINLVLMVWSTLGSQEIQKAKNGLSFKNWLSQKKICQKVGIYLILTLMITGIITGQAF